MRNAVFLIPVISRLHLPRKLCYDRENRTGRGVPLETQRLKNIAIVILLLLNACLLLLLGYCCLCSDM